MICPNKKFCSQGSNVKNLNRSSRHTNKKLRSNVILGSIRTPPVYALLIIPRLFCSALLCCALLYSIPTNLSCHCSYYENNKVFRSIGVGVDDRRMRNIGPRSTKTSAREPTARFVALFLSMACCKLQGRCSRAPCRLERWPNKGSVGPSAAARV